MRFPFSGMLSAGAIALACVSVALTAAIADQKPKPQRATLYPNYGPAPASLDQLWNDSQLIVRGIIEDTHVRRSAPSGRATVVTDHRLRIQEVLHSSISGGNRAVVHILQSAGTLVVDGTEITVDPGSMPVLAKGQEVLVFLSEWPAGGGFAITSGPNGLYILDEESVSLPQALRPLFANARQVSRAAFLETLRQLAARK